MKGFSSKGVDETVAQFDSNKHEIKKYYLSKMKFNGCIGCFYCRRKEGCVQKDDMAELFEDIISSDFIIFSSSVYNFDTNSNYKKMFERLYPMLAGGMALGEGKQKYTYRYPRKKCMLILSAGGMKFMSSGVMRRTKSNLKFNGFDNVGTVLIHSTYTRKEVSLNSKEKKSIKNICKKVNE